MPYEDLAAFVRPGFDLPWAGRVYYVPPPNPRDGLWLQALMDGSEAAVLTRSIGAANKAVLSDEQERTVYQLALGAAFEEMTEAGVPWPILKHAGITAWLHWTRGEAAGERHWRLLLDQGGQGKAETEQEEEPPTGGSPPAPSTLKLA
ncbi:MAG TPA: hypothetical protein VD864_00130 [Nocardioides sp.]|nr:hypothetical protein [Nocardioides sp.]